MCRGTYGPAYANTLALTAQSRAFFWGRFLARTEGRNVRIKMILKKKKKKKERWQQIRPRVDEQYLGYLNYVRLNMDAN